VTVEDSPRGKIVKALRSFAPGELLFVEKPAIAVIQSTCEFSMQDLQAWVDAFAALPHATRVSILELYCCEQAAPGGTLASLLGADGEGVAKLDCPGGMSEDIWHFLRIVECNTFQVPVSNGKVRLELALLGSRLNHSCCPNALRGPGREAGTIEIRALRPLEMGDEINLAYLDEKLYEPMEPRRAVLQARWQFKCECERCMAPDTLRAFRCEVCSGRHLAQSPEELGPCRNCGHVLPQEVCVGAVASEQRLQEALPQLEQEASSVVLALSGAIDGQDGQALTEAVTAGFAFLTSCQKLLQEAPHLAPEHHLGVRLSKAAVAVRTRLGDGFAAAGQTEQATELWGQSALELQQAIVAENVALALPRDNKASELIKLAGLYQRMGSVADSKRCLQDALAVMKLVYWACDETKRAAAEQLRQDIAASLDE